eukprot:gene8382-207_t
MAETIQSYLVKLILFLGVLMIVFQVIFKKVLVRRQITETFYTSGTSREHNVDSITYWNQKDLNWIIATAKATNELIVYSAVDGSLIKKISHLNLKRPNGIVLLPDSNIIAVVERDSHLIHFVSLPKFKTILKSPSHFLKRPYGIDSFKDENGIHHIYVTDNYMEAEFSKKKKKMKFSKIPPLSSLNKRVKHFKVDLKKKQIDLVNSFGETKGNGILYKVESIIIDRSYDHILIADEMQKHLGIRIYSLDGKYIKTFGEGVFIEEPEGFALLQCSNGKGYWIMVDQHKFRSIFHIFDRISFEHIGSFVGAFTANTDGVTLTQNVFGEFNAGAFFTRQSKQI